MHRIIAAFAAFCFVVFAFPASAQKLEGDEKKQAQQALEELLLNQHVVAKVNFPADQSGIDLEVEEGEWNASLVDRLLKRRGLGVAIDERVMITKVVLKGKHIEVQLNGGGRGTFSDFMSDLGKARSEDLTGITTSSRYSSDMVEGLKQPGGSRINLRFGRDITAADLDPELIIQYLSMLVDVSPLRQGVFAANIPEEYREAAEHGEILAGMDKQTVFAILGEPENRNVDISTSPPTETWQYNRDDLSVLIITFVGGKVDKVESF